MTARTYTSPAHESLLATWRCMIACFGLADANFRLRAHLRYFNVRETGELSPDGANYMRKQLQKQLPARGDFA